MVPALAGSSGRALLRGPWFGVASGRVWLRGRASAVLAWKADQRVATLEQEGWCGGQQDSSTNRRKARLWLAKQAQQGMEPMSTAKVALARGRRRGRKWPCSAASSKT